MAVKCEGWWNDEDTDTFAFLVYGIISRTETNNYPKPFAIEALLSIIAAPVFKYDSVQGRIAYEPSGG